MSDGPPALGISRRSFLRAAVGASGAVALDGRRPRANAAAATRPNFLFILSDQQHWMAAGYMDRSFVTPALDRLAGDAVIFRSAFCTTPQCSPSRASIYTGLYPHKTGVVSNIDSTDDRGRAVPSLGGDVPTIGDALKAAGYHTGYFGKWHLGNREQHREGFDERAIIDEGLSLEIVDPQITRGALAYLDGRARAAKPFAAFVNYLNPHDIYEDSARKLPPGAPDAVSTHSLPRSFYDESFRNKPATQREYLRLLRSLEIPIETKNERFWTHYREVYRDKVRSLDREVGAVLERLEALGLYESTIVIVTSDHGEMDGNHRLMFKGPFMYEHVVRVPLLARVPRQLGGLAPSRVDDQVVLVDVMPTLLDFAGKPSSGLDGYSWKPFLTGEGGLFPRPYVIGQFYSKGRWVSPLRMLRMREWKYVLCSARHEEELYHLANDPDELVNLAHDPTVEPVKRELRHQLDRWMAEHGDPFYSLSATTVEGRPAGAENR